MHPVGEDAAHIRAACKRLVRLVLEHAHAEQDARCEPVDPEFEHVALRELFSIDIAASNIEFAVCHGPLRIDVLEEVAAMRQAHRHN